MPRRLTVVLLEIGPYLGNVGLQGHAVDVAATTGFGVTGQRGGDDREIAIHSGVDALGKVGFPVARNDRIGQRAAHRLTKQTARNAILVLDVSRDGHEELDKVTIEQGKRALESVWGC